MKLSFEELEKSIHVCERIAVPAQPVAAGLIRTCGE
jgi:hypothetical protein